MQIRHAKEMPNFIYIHQLIAGNPRLLKHVLCTMQVHVDLEFIHYLS
jgi:hypothetical protein